MSGSAMPLLECLQVLRDRRSEEVVISSMGVAREWMQLSQHPLDFHFVPSSMGQATALGQGVALAQPLRTVIVCTGDGSMLMNLGSLVSLTAVWPRNLIVLLFDNGVYEVTGGQLTPAADPQRGDGSRIDFAKLAEACGFRSVWTFDSITSWREDLGEVLSQIQPVFVHLKVAPVPGAAGPKSPSAASERARAFHKALTGPARSEAAP